ncbi:MAG: hypothetical protein WBZ42_03530 [Halobacteriota archaeon]
MKEAATKAVEKRRKDDGDPVVMSFIIAEETSTLIIAFYGAVLSTITLIALLYTRYMDHRIRIDVIVGNAVTPFFSEDDMLVINIAAANAGGRETSLGTFTLLVNGRQLLLPKWCYHRDPPAEPYASAPGKQDLTVIVRSRALADILKKEGMSGVVPLKAVFQGAAGKKHVSKEMLFDIENAGVLASGQETV